MPSIAAASLTLRVSGWGMGAMIRGHPCRLQSRPRRLAPDGAYRFCNQPGGYVVTLSAGPIVIRNNSRLCNPMNEILVLTSALSYSMLTLTEAAKPAVDPNLCFNLPCARYTFSINVPIFGPIEGILKNETVTEMTLQAKVMPPAEEGTTRVQLGNILLNIVGPIFCNYYERQAEWLKANVDQSPQNWPGLLNFARVVRNAVVHFGRIRIDNPNAQAVSWRGVSYGPSDNGREIYVHDLNTGDFIALMVEIDHEMNALGAPAL